MQFRRVMQWVAVAAATMMTGLAAAQTGMDIETPPLSHPGDPHFVSAEFIYPLDDRPTPQCHASTIVETGAGLVAAWFGGTHERHPDVTIWVAHHDGQKWGKPVEVADGVESPEVRYPCWNPVLFQPEGGPLMLFYKVGPTPRDWWGMLITSIDGGHTWSAPQKLGSHNEIGHLLGPVKNKPIQLADGSILAGSSTEFDGWRVHFEISRDMGKSWHVIGPIDSAERFNSIQPSILTYPDGRMQILCRSKEQVITTNWSSDGGKTWGPTEATMLPNPSSGTDAVTLADGRQLLVYNHAERTSNLYPKGRDVLNVAISRDGVDWKPVLTLENDRKSQFAYPAVIQTRDGLVHITYTWRRETVKYVVLDPAKM